MALIYKVITLTFLAGLAYAGYEFWSMSMGQRSNAPLCVAVFNKSLGSASTRKAVLNLPNDGSWKRLKGNDYLAISQKLLIDSDMNYCFTSKNGFFLDDWGNPMEIAVRRKSGKVEFLAWSKGADNISGTQDDVVTKREDRLIIKELK